MATANYDWKITALKGVKALGLLLVSSVLATFIGTLTSPEFSAQLKGVVDTVAGSIPFVGSLLVPALYSALTGLIAAAVVAIRNWQKNAGI